MRLAILMTLAGAAGCATGLECQSPERYAGARTVAPYEVPAGLERPSDRERLRIPQGTDAVPEGLRGDHYEAADGSLRCLDQPPPMRRDAVNIEG